MNGDKVFVDTNVIIYAYTTTVRKKHETALEVMTHLWHSGLGALSTQVLQEFFVVVSQKVQKPLNVKTATEIVKDLLKWDVVINDGESILDAIDIQKRYKYSFWDSLIIDAALKSGAKILLSEDLKDGQMIQELQISNPFKL